MLQPYLKLRASFCLDDCLADCDRIAKGSTALIQGLNLLVIAYETRTRSRPLVFRGNK